MKKNVLLFAFFVSGLLCQTAYAQVSFEVNLGIQPIWGPVGYDYVEYYYLPDIEAYYYVPSREYIYIENNRWVTRSYLPYRYKGHDMYNTRKVVINEQRPYMRHYNYRAKYATSNERSHQQSIRDSRESRYYVNKNHPEHNHWKQDQKNQKKQSRQSGKQGKRH